MSNPHSTRALRRHHRARIQAKALRLLRQRRAWSESLPALSDPCVYRRAEHFAACSCPMCGNPRRHRAWANRAQWNGRTRAEYLAALDEREQVSESEERSRKKSRKLDKA